jgi:SAM-dependent methyltransferase
VDPTFANRYYESAQAGHWWFNGRVALVKALLSENGIFGGLVGDLGAGSSSLFPSTFGVVGFDAAVPKRRAEEFVQADVRRLPVRDEFLDGVGLFDVLEHVDNPRTLLIEARRVVKPGGFLIITVPAHQWLWSSHDELVGHVQRYEGEQLVDELGRAGWGVQSCREFFGFLVPGAIIRRFGLFNPSFAYPRFGLNELLTRLAVRSARSSTNGSRRIGLSIGAVAFNG